MPSFNMQCPVEQVSASVCLSITLPPWSKWVQVTVFMVLSVNYPWNFLKTILSQIIQWTLLLSWMD